MSEDDHQRDVRRYYGSKAAAYHEQYERERLQDTSRHYPANYFRLQLLLNSFLRKGLKRIIEVGVGEGTPLAALGRAGIDIWGFDISEEMVERSKENMLEHGMDADHIFWGDIEDPITYTHMLHEGLFDGLMAMGVMPHVRNEEVVLKNMATLVRPGGTVFIEFRNKLFSLFTFNRYTYDFILNDLLKDVEDDIKDAIAEDLESRLRMDMPPVRTRLEGTDAPGYDAILSKFHNPFEVVELFEKLNFRDIEILWYHYHPAMPYLADKMPERFRAEALHLEHETSGWRGMFLCSAFVVEAVKA
ncbi:MAG: class I SAM-dependent methyltransferase [Chloroflexota bacterium]